MDGDPGPKNNKNYLQLEEKCTLSQKQKRGINPITLSPIKWFLG